MLSLREQFNVICPVDLLCDDPDFIRNGELIDRTDGESIAGTQSHSRSEFLQGPGVFIYTDTDMHIVGRLLG